MTIRTAVKALAPYRFTPRPEPIKLDQNESPDDVPEVVKERVARALANVAWNRYPDLGPRMLEARLAERHGVPAEAVVVANGSNTLIQAITIVSGVGRSVVTVAPTFAVYSAQARLLGAELVEVPLLPGFALPERDLAAALAGRAGVLFLANPAAPTGNLFEESAIERLVEAAGPELLVVLDEAYAEFAGKNLEGLAARHENVVILRTFSKALGLAGARVGYALAHPEVAEELRKALLPFSVSAWQTTVATTLLDEQGIVAERVRHVLAERRRLGAALAALPGVEPFPSEANFILFRVADPEAWYRRLLEAGVVIRRQDHLPGAERCLRVSVGTCSENDAFLAACEAAAAADVPLEGRDGPDTQR